MPAFDLPRLARAQGIRKSSVTIRPIEPTQAHAQELARLYMPIVRAWQANIEPIMAGYTLPTLDALTTDAPADQQAAIDRTAEEVSRLIVAFGAGVEAWTTRVERWSRNKWISGVKAATRVDLSSILLGSDVDVTVEATIAANVELVKDVSAEIRNRISGAVFRGYQNGTPARQVAREIAEATQLGRKRSQRIANDQLNKFTAALERDRREQAGVTLYKYRHSGKRHPREHHKARNGYVYNAKTGKSVNGGPGIPADDRAGMAPFCACREQAYLALQLELENA